MQKASQSEQKLIQHLGEALQESADKKLSEHVDQALQAESLARHDLHCSLTGRIESLAALVEEAFQAEAAARGDLAYRLEALAGVGNDNGGSVQHELHASLEEVCPRSAAFVRGELSGRIQMQRTPSQLNSTQLIVHPLNDVAVSETEELDPEQSSVQMKALLHESFRGILDVCDDDSRQLGEGNSLNSRLQQHQSLLSAKLQEHQDCVERHIAAVCSDVKRLAGAPVNASEKLQLPAAAFSRAVPQSPQAQPRCQDEAPPRQRPQTQQPQQQQQQQQPVTRVRWIDPVPTPDASRSKGSIEVPCVERTPASSPTGSTSTMVAITAVSPKVAGGRIAAATPMLSSSGPASAPAVFVTATMAPRHYEAAPIASAGAGIKAVLPPASYPCLGSSTLTAPASSACSTPMIGGSAVISRATADD